MVVGLVCVRAVGRSVVVVGPLLCLRPGAPSLCHHPSYRRPFASSSCHARLCLSLSVARARASSVCRTKRRMAGAGAGDGDGDGDGALLPPALAAFRRPARDRCSSPGCMAGCEAWPDPSAQRGPDCLGEAGGGMAGRERGRGRKRAPPCSPPWLLLAASVSPLPRLLRAPAAAARRAADAIAARRVVDGRVGFPVAARARRRGRRPTSRGGRRGRALDARLSRPQRARVGRRRRLPCARAPADPYHRPPAASARRARPVKGLGGAEARSTVALKRKRLDSLSLSVFVIESPLCVVVSSLWTSSDVGFARRGQRDARVA